MKLSQKKGHSILRLHSLFHRLKRGSKMQEKVNSFLCLAVHHLAHYSFKPLIHRKVTYFSLKSQTSAYCLFICWLRVHLWLGQLAGRLSQMTSLLAQYLLQLGMELLLLHLQQHRWQGLRCHIMMQQKKKKEKHQSGFVMLFLVFLVCYLCFLFSCALNFKFLLPGSVCKLSLAFPSSLHPPMCESSNLYISRVSYCHSLPELFW